jgi:hypothetical protein
MENKAANSEDSRQYRLLTHLYQYFGAALGCSEYGKMGFPAYQGDTNMAEVHRFMNIDADENGYFIQQVGLSAASFGVTEEDVTAVGTLLTNTFNYRCSPPAAVLPNAPKEPQAICQAEDCPLSPNATCSIYPTETHPASASASSGGNMTMPTSTMGSGMGGSGSGASQTTGAGAPAYTGAAVKTFGSVVAAVGAAALAVAL